MPTYRFAVRYTACALSAYGFASCCVAATPPHVHVSEFAHPSGSWLVPGSSVEHSFSSADEKRADAGGHSLNRDLVQQAVTAVQSSGIFLMHPMSGTPCPSNNCPSIIVTGSYGGVTGSYGGGMPGGGIGSPVAPPPDPKPPPTLPRVNCFTPLSAKPRANQAEVDVHELGPPHDQSGPGGMALNGYVPSASSGVTIGFGVDLGQLNASQLKAYGVSQAIIDELEPWIGPKGQQAQALLQSHMLTLSAADATTLSNDVFNGVYNALQTNFDNNNSMTFYTFEQLPAGAQTALTDMEYNNGDIWDASNSLVVDAANDASDGNWAGMAQDLNTLYAQQGVDRYSTDATEIQNAINQHLLPAKANLDNGKDGECPQP